MVKEIEVKVIFGLAIGACVAITGCSGGVSEADAAQAGFYTPTSTGSVTSGLSQVSSGSEFNSDGDGIAYAVGATDGNGLRARAGIIPGADVTRTLTTGVVNMSGRWELWKVEGVSASSTFVSGNKAFDGASINLSADFGQGTLTGSSSGLSVNGTFAGETLSGSVTYDGVDGRLRGLVGDDEAIGVFHGEGNSEIFAGGFVVEE